MFFYIFQLQNSLQTFTTNSKDLEEEKNLTQTPNKWLLKTFKEAFSASA